MLYITCKDEFSSKTIIDHFFVKELNNYINVPLSLSIDYLDAEYNEPSFAPSYEFVGNGNLSMINGLTNVRSEGFFDDEEDKNKTSFVFSPKRNDLNNSEIIIEEIQSQTNNFSIDKIEYTIFLNTDDEIQTRQSIDYPYDSFPLKIDDKEYNQDECLVMKFNFKDNLDNSSPIWGGSLLFKVKINGDSYNLYRHVNYYR